MTLSPRFLPLSPLFTCAALTLVASPAFAKPYKGAELYSSETVQYGRFEMRMRAAEGSGLLSTFFTYKDGSEIAGSVWEEIDIEIFGKDGAKSWQTNIIYGNPKQMTEAVHQETTSLADAYHTYTLEWTPTYVAWSLDGREVRRVEGEAVEQLVSPQGLRFNLWSSDSVPWVGPFDDSILPRYQYVDWVRYSRYEDGKFVEEWRDDFDTLNSTRWQKADWTFEGNRVDFAPGNIAVKDGKLILALTKEGQEPDFSQVPPDTEDPDQPGNSDGNGQAGAPGTKPSEPELKGSGGCSVAPQANSTSSSLFWATLSALGLGAWATRRRALQTQR